MLRPASGDVATSTDTLTRDARFQPQLPVGSSSLAPAQPSDAAVASAGHAPPTYIVVSGEFSDGHVDTDSVAPTASGAPTSIDTSAKRPVGVKVAPEQLPNADDSVHGLLAVERPVTLPDSPAPDAVTRAHVPLPCSARAAVAESSTCCSRRPEVAAATSAATLTRSAAGTAVTGVSARRTAYEKAPPRACQNDHVVTLLALLAADDRTAGPSGSVTPKNAPSSPAVAAVVKPPQ